MVQKRVYLMLVLLLALFPGIFTLSNSGRPATEVAPPVAEATGIAFTVSASIYFPEQRQTDSEPLVTADGSRINPVRPRQHRWIALSRDLLIRWGGSFRYGDTVEVSGLSEELDGLYTVHDTMHRRFRKTIDILVGKQDRIMGHWKGVRIRKIGAAGAATGAEKQVRAKPTK